MGWRDEIQVVAGVLNWRFAGSEVDKISWGETLENRPRQQRSSCLKVNKVFLLRPKSCVVLFSSSSL